MDIDEYQLKMQFHKTISIIVVESSIKIYQQSISN